MNWNNCSLKKYAVCIDHDKQSEDMSDGKIIFQIARKVSAMSTHHKLSSKSPMSLDIVSELSYQMVWYVCVSKNIGKRSLKGLKFL